MAVRVLTALEMRDYISGTAAALKQAHGKYLADNYYNCGVPVVVTLGMLSQFVYEALQSIDAAAEETAMHTLVLDMVSTLLQRHQHECKNCDCDEEQEVAH